MVEVEKWWQTNAKDVRWWIYISSGKACESILIKTCALFTTESTHINYSEYANSSHSNYAK